jgi:hypothetical protein
MCGIYQLRRTHGGQSGRQANWLKTRGKTAYVYCLPSFPLKKKKSENKKEYARAIVGGQAATLGWTP